MERASLRSHLRSSESDGRRNLARLTLAGSERVLDIGCGDGKITAEVAARLSHGSVLGVDPARDMIAFAEQRFAASNRPNLRFAVADVRSLAYRAEFDLVISFNALHWVPEQDLALRSIRAALKADGRTLLQFVPQGGRVCLEDVIEATRRQPRWAGLFNDFRKPYRHCTPAEYRTLAEQAGLRVEELTIADKSWDFGSRAAFEAFCRATFVEWTQRLPMADHAAFIADVLDSYEQVVADPNTFKFYQMVAVLRPAPGSQAG